MKIKPNTKEGNPHIFYTSVNDTLNFWKLLNNTYSFVVLFNFYQLANLIINASLL